ncbi:MAG: HEPN domain-containing protein [Candidatus Methylomirabilia bacterium]
MTNREMAEGLLTQAGDILLEAEGLHRRGVWNLVVRRSQEVVELALKAALRIAGVEVPRIHDVGIILKDHREKFPEPFGKEIDRVASISRRLRREREVSFYGDEETGAPPQRLYTEDEARVAVEEAGSVLDRCRELLRGLGEAGR